MKNENRSQAFLRKRKMMLVVPLLIVPFLTMAFWTLGGGQGSQIEKKPKSEGLNLNLPSSGLKENKADNKLSFYEKAAKDSAKLEEWIRNDPYYKNHQDTFPTTPLNELEQLTASTASKFNQHLNTSPYEAGGPNPEQKLIQKLAQLKNELDKPGNGNKHSKGEKESGNSDLSVQMSRLEGMMENMQASDEEDPEIKQLGSTLDKILDIQHPQRVKDRLKQRSEENKGIVFIVSASSREQSISLLGSKTQNEDSGFFGLENSGADTGEDNSIEAVVSDNQTLVNGAIIRFRLMNDAYIHGKLIPKGTFINGTTTLNGERLDVEINSVRAGNSIFPVKLAVYDLDGLAGIYIPGSISRDAAKQSADNSLQMLELSTMDPSLKAQIAATGVNTAKSLLSKKTKQVKVVVKTGYKVLLKNKTEQD